MRLEERERLAWITEELLRRGIRIRREVVEGKRAV